MRIEEEEEGDEEEEVLHCKLAFLYCIGKVGELTLAPHLQPCIPTHQSELCRRRYSDMARSVGLWDLDSLAQGHQLPVLNLFVQAESRTINHLPGRLLLLTMIHSCLYRIGRNDITKVKSTMMILSPPSELYASFKMDLKRSTANLLRRTKVTGMPIALDVQQR